MADKPINLDVFDSSPDVQPSGNSANAQPALKLDVFDAPAQTPDSAPKMELNAANLATMGLDWWNSKNKANVASAAVHGFGSGLTYNFLDEAGDILDGETSSRFRASQKDSPLIYSLGQLGGAILSPNPVGKWKALKDATTLVKMAVGGARFAAEAGLSVAGESEKKGLDRLSDVKAAADNPLVQGLGALSIAAPALPKILKAGSDFLVNDGKKSYQLGKGMKEALSSPEGQEIVTKAVNTFEGVTRDAAKKGMGVLGEQLDNIAAANKGVKVKAYDAFENLTSLFDDFSAKSDKYTQEEATAMSNLKEWYLKAQKAGIANAGDALTTGKSGRALDNLNFEDVYQAKRALGDLVFDSKARLFNKAETVKRSAVAMYDKLSKLLESADETTTYKDVNKGFSGLYKTYDGLDELGTSLTQMSDKLKALPAKKRDAIIQAYNSIPEQFKAKMPELTDQINRQMDEIVTTYSIANKIAGKNPGRSTIISEIANKLPVISEASRLQLLNRYGREQAGNAVPMLSGLVDPSGIIRQGGRGLSTFITPDEEIK